MTTFEITRMTISGYLVGTIWMPAAECYKPLTYDVLREARRYTEPDSVTLRDHVLSATNDGDFQSCAIADGELLVTIARHEGNKRYTRTRAFPLAMFPSIADCIKTDWDGPAFGD